MNDFVLPEESAEHAAFCASSWSELKAAGPIEETFATETIRAAWRLRRCRIVEARLAETPNETKPISGCRTPWTAHAPGQ